jgi:hypothetical protein
VHELLTRNTAGPPPVRFALLVADRDSFNVEAESRDTSGGGRASEGSVRSNVNGCMGSPCGRLAAPANAGPEQPFGIGSARL